MLSAKLPAFAPSAQQAPSAERFRISTRRYAALLFGLLGVLLVWLLADRWIARATTVVPPIRLGINPWPGYAFAFLARDLGYFDEAGLDVQLVESGSLAAVRRSFERGQVDGMFCTVVEVLHANEQSPRGPQISLVCDYSDGADVILADRRLQQLTELRGKRIAYEPGSLHLFLLKRALDTVGLTLNDVELDPAPADEMPSLLEKGIVDAVVSYPPISLQILRESGYHEIFSSEQIPREVLDVMALSRDFIKSRPHEIERLLAAYHRAVQYAHDHPVEAHARFRKV